MPTGYTPPTGNAVNLNFTGAYSVPVGNAVNLNFFNVVGYTLSADPGVLAVSGSAAALKVARVMRAYTDLIPNGRFSLNAAGWSIDGADTAIAAVGGEGVLTLGPAASGGFAWVEVPVTPGKRYTLSGRLKSSGYVLNANSGSYAIAGTAATLSQSTLAVFIEDTDLFDDGTFIARVGYKLRPDGLCIETFSDTRLRHDWLPASASGADYEVRATKTSGTTPSGDLVNTWLRVNVNRHWDLTRSGSSGTTTCTLFVEVRPYGGGAVLASGTITMTAEVF